MANIRNKKKQKHKDRCSKIYATTFHKLPSKEYSIRDSQVVQWLIRHPQILDFVWDKIKQSGDVFYNNDTGKWQGIDYEPEEE